MSRPKLITENKSLDLDTINIKDEKVVKSIIKSLEDTTATGDNTLRTIVLQEAVPEDKPVETLTGKLLEEKTEKKTRLTV